MATFEVSVTEGYLDLAPCYQDIFNAKNYLLTWRTLVLQSITSPEQSTHVQKRKWKLFPRCISDFSPKFCNGHWEGIFRVGRKNQKT